MIYVIANPFHAGPGTTGSGVDSYCQDLYELLRSSEQFCVVLLERARDESLRTFYHRLKREIRKYRDSRLTVEFPDSRTPFFALPGNAKVHVRLHCPLSIAQKKDGVRPNIRTRLAEQHVLLRADHVSAPSAIMLTATRNSFFIRSSTTIYPNPVPTTAHGSPSCERDIDVLIVGRNQPLKGAEFIPSLLARIGREMHVAIAGAGFERLQNEPGVGNATVFGPVSRREVRSLMSRSKIVLVLSVFESFSTVVVEALAHGAQVVCWNTIGVAEWLCTPRLKLVPLGCTSRLIDSIRESLDVDQAVGTRDADLEPSLRRLNELAKAGVESVLNSLWALG